MSSTVDDILNASDSDDGEMAVDVDLEGLLKEDHEDSFDIDTALGRGSIGSNSGGGRSARSVFSSSSTTATASSNNSYNSNNSSNNSHINAIDVHEGQRLLRGVVVGHV